MQTAGRKLITAEELFWMPDDGRRYELVRGVLREMPPPGDEHGNVEGLVYFRLMQFVYPRGLGVVRVGETGFVVSRDPDTVRGADVAFISKERVSPGRVTSYREGAPDLVVEVVSPGDRPSEVQSKVREWLDGGARLVWAVYPDSRTVRVHLPGAEPVVLQATDYIEGGDVIPGFRCRVAEFFE